ncbi:MAG: hypothetical protein HYY52_02560 [Candidatus Melainabacteria bacterium]|nr:hypothetical protein [Candidatus Melainabacteria bacterium]
MTDSIRQAGTQSQPLLGQAAQQASVQSIEIEKLQEKLKERIKYLGERVNGANRNLQNTQKECNNCGFWAKVSGLTSTLKKQLENDRRTREQLTEQRNKLLETQRQVTELVKQGNFSQAKALIENKQQESRQQTIQVGKQAIQNLQEANKGIESADKFLSRTETALKVTRNTAIIVGATVATGGAAGAIAAAGYGTAAVAAGAIAAGTTAGTTIGAVSNAGEATLHVAYGNKTIGQAASDAAGQTMQDAKSSLVASVGTVTGMGAGNVVGGVAGKALSSGATKLVQGSTAGLTNAAVSTTVNTKETIEARIKAEQEFNSLYSEQTKNMSQEKIDELRQNFLQQRGLTTEQIIGHGAVNLGVGLVSGGQGATASAMRAATKSIVKKAGITAAEATTLAATGIGAAYARDGKVSFEAAAQEISGAAIGSTVGSVSTTQRNNKAPLSTQQPSQSATSKQTTTIPHEQLPQAIRESNAFKYANGNTRADHTNTNKTQRSVVVEVDNNLPGSSRPQAEVVVDPKTRNRTTKIRLDQETYQRLQSGDEKALQSFQHELRHANRSSPVDVHVRDGSGNTTRTRSAREYVALRALEEFQVRAGRGTGQSPNNPSVQHTREMQRLISEGDHIGAIRYARQNGITPSDLRNYGSNYATNKINPNQIVQRGNSSTEEELNTGKLSDLANEIENALADQLLKDGENFLNLLSRLKDRGKALSSVEAFREAAIKENLDPFTARERLIKFLESNSRQDMAKQLDESLSSLHAIRIGKNGEVRKAGLTTKDVIAVIDDQLAPISAFEIKKMIDSYPPEMRGPALNALKRLTQFANIESLDSLNNKLLRMVQDSFEIYTDRHPSLATNLLYYRKKGTFSNELPITKLENLESWGLPRNGKKPALLIDEPTLKRLENDPEFAQFLQKQGVLLIIPEGWFSGINPFNQHENIKGKLDKVLKRAEEIHLQNAVDMDRAIAQAINEPVRQRLQKLGFNVDKVQTLRQDLDFKASNPDEIASRLSPKRMTETELDKLLLKIIPEGHRNFKPYVLELLAHDANIFSTRRLSLAAKEQHSKVLEIAKEKSVDPKDILYFIPETNKSFGLATMQYCIVNNINPKQVITRVEQMRNAKGKPKMVVVLDDNSLSGTTLATVYNGLRNVSKVNCPIVISPTIATTESQRRFNDFSKDTNLYFIPHQVVVPFRESAYYKSLNQNQQRMFDSLMGGEKSFGFGLNGYGKTASNIALPHMAPNNNNAFFNKVIAPFLVVNPEAVKKDSTWKAPWSRKAK